MPGGFELRPPKALRIYGWVFGAVWLTLASTSVVAVDGAWGAVPFALGFVSVGGFLIVRVNRVAAIAEPDGLTLRNYSRTRRFARAKVVGSAFLQQGADYSAVRLRPEVGQDPTRASGEGAWRQIESATIRNGQSTTGAGRPGAPGGASGSAAARAGA